MTSLFKKLVEEAEPSWSAATHRAEEPQCGGGQRHPLQTGQQDRGGGQQDTEQQKQLLLQVSTPEDTQPLRHTSCCPTTHQQGAYLCFLQAMARTRRLSEAATVTAAEEDTTEDSMSPRHRLCTRTSRRSAGGPGPAEGPESRFYKSAAALVPTHTHWSRFCSLAPLTGSHPLVPPTGPSPTLQQLGSTHWLHLLVLVPTHWIH